MVSAEGADQFDPDSHSLRRAVDGDLRALTGVQDYVGQAPLNLVYVADFGRIEASEENKWLYSAADAGFVAQNAYLFCASTGLATVVRDTVDRPTLAVALRLPPQRQIILAQTVGYPK